MAHRGAVLTIVNFAETAALIGDPARANMLAALMDGRALTARELAEAAGVMPQTASAHLARLAEAGLLTMERQGRHRYHRLASPAVAHMLESIMSVAAAIKNDDLTKPRRPVIVGPRDTAMRQARTCYDHLAGRIAVAIADRRVERGQIELSPDDGSLSEEGAVFLHGIGVDLGHVAAPASRRGGGRMFCRPCLDWSERRPHIAGALGRALWQSGFARDWFRCLEGTRAIAMTPAGHGALRKAFDIQ